MPADELDQLGPGAALDAIVAREVFGLDVLGELPTANDPALPWPVPADRFDAVVRPVYVLPGYDDDNHPGREDTVFQHGIDTFAGHHPSALRAVPRYSADPVACASVVKACRDAGRFDGANCWRNSFYRVFSFEIPGEGWSVDATGSHEYAVACVGAVRVARLVGGPLVGRVALVAPDGAEGLVGRGD